MMETEDKRPVHTLVPDVAKGLPVDEPDDVAEAESLVYNLREQKNAAESTEPDEEQ